MSATAVLAAGSLAYSSPDRLYVATIDQSWWDDVVPLGADDGGRVAAAPGTEVHAFALDGRPRPRTSPAVGCPAPSATGGRSASTRVGCAWPPPLGRGWDPRENSVQVLAEEGERLRVVGAVTGLGPREQIQSVRWLGDLAIVVTFRQVDPLYTLDLADPERPADPR